MNLATTALSPTQEMALHKGMSFLRATNLRFAIEMPDQTYLGELPVPKEALPIKERKVRRHDIQDKFGYHSKVDLMEPGQKLPFVCASDEEATRLISHLSGRGCSKFGKGSCMSARNGLHVELLRIF